MNIMKLFTLLMLLADVLLCVSCSGKLNSRLDKISTTSSNGNIADKNLDDDRQLALHISYLKWHNQQSLADEALRPYTSYKSKIDDEAQSFNINKVIKEQELLIDSIKSNNKNKTPEFVAALQEWLFCQRKALNILIKMVGESEVSVSDKNTPNEILEVQKRYGKKLEEENKILGKLDLEHIQ